PSGQREQTVNLSASLSVVRIHPRPPQKHLRICVGVFVCEQWWCDHAPRTVAYIEKASNFGA
ncbi:MAG: hypothetical protein K2L88_01470, partial [Clostridiales bacterium]|nr:hypothetical protein [Clostridiales bacterium]